MVSAGEGLVTQPQPNLPVSSEMDNQPHPYIILHPCYLKGNWKVRVIEVVILDCVAGKRSAAGLALGTSLGTATHTMAVCVAWMKMVDLPHKMCHLHWENEVLEQWMEWGSRFLDKPRLL